MTLTVETGAIVAGANSYLSLADANTYHDDRGNSGWTGTDAVKEAALVRATDYLVQKFRKRWKGIRVNLNQTLDWPRAGVMTDDYFEPQSGPRPALYPGLSYVIPENTVPQEVKDATAELALRALSGTLADDLARGGRIQSESVGPISTSYFAGAPPGTIYQAVEWRISVLLRNNGGNTRRLVRS